MMQEPQRSISFSATKDLLPVVVPAMLLCCLSVLYWRFFGYYIDPDAISYLNITAAYIKGDYAHAINAFWSPMGCWTAALWAKATGWQLFASAIAVNTLAATGMVAAGQCLFQRFRSAPAERWCFGIMSAFFWAYTVYFQSFTDIWQFFFLTLGLLILLGKQFTHKPLWWLCLGLTGALAYFGKAYSFYFFPLMVLVVTALRLNSETGRIDRKRLLLIVLITIGTMMLTIFPWLYLIHHKYGIWTSSTAGKLNMSWWLVGTQEFRPGIKALVPPPYPGSLYYFEDPYLAQGPMVHFWDSPRLFAKQLIRTGYNVIGWTESANRISAFYFLIWLLCILFLYQRNKLIRYTADHRVIAVIFLIFPLPYWLLTFDGGRYLWFTIPLCSILALHMAEIFLFPRLGRRLSTLLIMIFFATFLVTPFSDLKGMFHAGKSEYEIAERLKELGIKGSFISNRSYADGATRMIRISWFSQNPWYCHTLGRYTTQQLLEDAARYNVRYYFYFYDGTGEDYRFYDPEGVILPDLTGGRLPGLKIYQIGTGNNK